MPSEESPPRLILASASPRRRELLQQTSLRFRVIPSHMEETRRDKEPPETYVARIAAEKARAIAERQPGFWILAADTIVALEGRVFGKPANLDNARQMLTTLSGHPHQVMTAFVLLDTAGNTTAAEVVTSQVTFKELSASEVTAYLATGEPFDKAGAYAFQGKGRDLIAQVSGSHSNIIGLPMDEVTAALRTVGLLPA
ncbi:MAG: Maf family protein [Desulfurellaceae bacterium]|nr:Maf family protein [Desulfurellaceae bacterium]